MKEIHYTLDGGAERVVAGASTSLSVSSVGGHRVSYYAVDRAGHAEAAKALSLNVDPGGLAVTTATPVPAVVGQGFSLTLGAKGGKAPYTFTVTGALPDGLTRSGAVISGTPAAAGTASLVVTVTDKRGAQASTNLTFEVTSPLVVTTPALVSLGGLVGLTATGGVAPLTWAATTTLPPGLLLRGATVVPDGTAVLGEYPVTFTVTDDAGKTATKTITFGVYDPITVSGPANVSAAVGDALSLEFTASGGRDGGYTWSFASDAPPPAGLTIDPATGTVTGVVATASTWTVGVVATDTAGGTGATYFVLSVQ